MRGGYAVRPLVWVMVPLVVIVAVVSIVVIQRNQSALPSAPTGNVVPSRRPGSVGGAASDALTNWASAAAVRDYVAAEQHMIDDTTLYTFWHDSHENFASNITGYRILDKETVGQTTTAQVGFDTASGGAHCIIVQVDESTQKVRVDQPYGDCPAQ